MGCLLLPRSPESGHWASVFRPEWRLRTRRLLEQGGADRETAALRPGGGVFQHSGQICPAASPSSDDLALLAACSNGEIGLVRAARSSACTANTNRSGAAGADRWCAAAGRSASAPSSPSTAAPCDDQHPAIAPKMPRHLSAEIARRRILSG